MQGGWWKTCECLRTALRSVGTLVYESESCSGLFDWAEYLIRSRAGGSLFTQIGGKGCFLNRLSLAFISLSVVGIVIAILLTYEYVTANFTSCNINSFFSCGSVASSPYSKFFGIPMYIFGLIWFPLLFIISSAYSGFARKELNAYVLVPLLLLGDIFTIYLWYEQLVLIGKLCPYCVSLYFVNYILTVLALLSLRE